MINLIKRLLCNHLYVATGGTTGNYSDNRLEQYTCKKCGEKLTLRITNIEGDIDE